MKTTPLLLVGALFLGAFFLGPRTSYEPIDFKLERHVPERLSELDGWLKLKESAFKNIKANNEKTIVWANGERATTPWSVVYIHGFSASRLESAPLAELVADKLKANVFYTRLSGHGQRPEDLKNATPHLWVNDYLEALEIGHRIGKRVLVISCSTGSTIAALASQMHGTKDTHGAQDARNREAHVFISPNFGPKDKRAEIILAPWGEQLAFLIEGKTHLSASPEPDEQLGWYDAYPTESLFPMMYLVKLARNSRLQDFNSPLLVLYSERDRVVDVEKIKTAFAQIGSQPKTLISIEDSDSKGQHVLAGRIKAPKALEPIKEQIVQWVQTLEHAQGLR